MKKQINIVKRLTGQEVVVKKRKVIKKKQTIIISPVFICPHCNCESLHVYDDHSNKPRTIRSLAELYCSSCSFVVVLGHYQVDVLKGDKK